MGVGDDDPFMKLIQHRQQKIRPGSMPAKRRLISVRFMFLFLPDKMVNAMGRADSMIGGKG